MEAFRSCNKSLIESLPSSISSINPKLIEDTLVSWSSSVWSELTCSNLRGCMILVGRSLEPKNIEKTLLLLSSSVSTFMKENPILFSVPLGNGIQTYVNLPYAGAVSLDVFLFWSSTVLSRAYMFWINRRRKTDGNVGRGSNNDHCRSSSPVKATVVTGYKDESLYKTIQECQDVRKALRKVADPDLVRKEKKRQLAMQNLRYKIKGSDSSDGYLGMSPLSLQKARKFLRQVEPTQPKAKRATE